MSETVIRVENLSKKYVIDHQSASGYSTLRDKITDGAKSLGQLLILEEERSLHKRRILGAEDVSFEVKQGDRLGIIGPQRSRKIYPAQNS
jgi:lipopolysaccharide transport system ATP-binding protein